MCYCHCCQWLLKRKTILSFELRSWQEKDCNYYQEWIERKQTLIASYGWRYHRFSRRYGNTCRWCCPWSIRTIVWWISYDRRNRPHEEKCIIRMYPQAKWNHRARRKEHCKQPRCTFSYGIIWYEDTRWIRENGYHSCWRVQLHRQDIKVIKFQIRRSHSITREVRSNCYGHQWVWFEICYPHCLGLIRKICDWENHIEFLGSFSRLDWNARFHHHRNYCSCCCYSWRITAISYTLSRLFS